MLFSALLAITIISNGPRPWYWFLLQGVLLLLVMVVAEDTPPLFLGVILAAISAVTAFSIILSEGIGIIGIDQWRDYSAGQMIVNYGDLAKATSSVNNQYYASLPFIPSLFAGGALLTTGNVLQVVVMLAPAVAFVATLACVLVSMKLPYGKVVAVVATSLVLSSQRLIVWEIIPSIFSISLASVLILIFYLLYINPGSISRIAVPFLVGGVLVATIVHPAGTIAIMAICVGLIVFFAIQRTLRVRPNTFPVRTSLYLSLALIAILYLDVNNFLSNLISAEVVSPLVNLLKFRAGPHPPLSELGGDFAVIAWSAPIALVFSFLFERIVRQKVQARSIRVERYIIACALVGLLLVIAGFLERGAAFERYVSTPGFLLLIFPASFLLAYIFNSSRSAALIALVVIALVLSSGSTSFNWAPDLYPNPIFEFSGLSEYAIASTMVHYVPNNLSLGAILAVGDPLSSNLQLNGVRFTLIRSFYNFLLENRAIDPCLLSSFTSSPDSLFVIGGSTLPSSCQTTYDVVFSSGEYTGIVFSNTQFKGVT